MQFTISRWQHLSLFSDPWPWIHDGLHAVHPWQAACSPCQHLQFTDHLLQPVHQRLHISCHFHLVTGLHIQKAHTSLGTSSLQILLLSAHACMHFAWELQLDTQCVHLVYAFRAIPFKCVWGRQEKKILTPPPHAPHISIFLGPPPLIWFLHGPPLH